MEIPSRLSTTGESPLYDLRFRWTQSRHIVRFDLTSRYKKQRYARASELSYTVSSASQRMGAFGFVWVTSRPVCWIIRPIFGGRITRCVYSRARNAIKFRFSRRCLFCRCGLSLFDSFRKRSGVSNR